MNRNNEDDDDDDDHQNHQQTPGFTFGSVGNVHRSRDTSPITPAFHLTFGNPYYLNPNENLSQSIVNTVLDGSNYQMWSRSVRFALKTKHKVGFIDGSIPPPPPASDRYPLWDACNTMVLCWIANSLHPEIRRSVLNHENALVLWQELKRRFGQANALKMAIYKMRYMDVSRVKCQSLNTTQ